MTQYSRPKVAIDLEEYNELLEKAKLPKDIFTPEELYKVFTALVNLTNPLVPSMSSAKEREDHFNKDMMNINLKVVIQLNRLIIQRIK